MTIFTHTFKTPIGTMRASSCEGKISGLWFEGQKYFPKTSDWIERELKIFDDLKFCLERYFDKEAIAARFLRDKSAVLIEMRGENSINLELRLLGSEFELLVWEKLCGVEYGKTTSYGDIAREIEREQGRRVSFQAVGNAVAHNKISILIPCHRVLGADKSLRGYAGGLEKKRSLLLLENAVFRDAF